MLGRVGRDRCTQLRGLLHSQQSKLREAESRDPRDAQEIASIKHAIEITKQKLAELEC